MRESLLSLSAWAGSSKNPPNFSQVSLEQKPNGMFALQNV